MVLGGWAAGPGRVPGGLALTRLHGPNMWLLLLGVYVRGLLSFGNGHILCTAAYSYTIYTYQISAPVFLFGNGHTPV